MENPGLVTLNGQVVGSFELDPDEKVSITFDKGAAGVEETLEYATEHGMSLGLMLKPEFGEE